MKKCVKLKLDAADQNLPDVLVDDVGELGRGLGPAQKVEDVLVGRGYAAGGVCHEVGHRGDRLDDDALGIPLSELMLRSV